MPEIVDVLVIGGGISGVSLAAKLAGHMSVALVEAEEHLGMHATGRSAALFVEAYGPPVIRQLTGMSRSFFEAPPDGFAQDPLTNPRGALVYADEHSLPKLGEDFEQARLATHVVWLDSDEVLARCPLIKPGLAVAGYLEPGVLDIDTHALLYGFARTAERGGACIQKGTPVRRIERQGEGWLVSSDTREFVCGLLIDAAGPWADVVAELAGVARRGLQPMRRTAATLKLPPDLAPLVPGLPSVVPVDESFYFKPDAGAIMVSLSEETPSEPCDAFPDDFDVAVALERFHEATIVPRGRPVATWAGLRTFAPDRNPVVGFDADHPRFFWYAGQGGYGIQTSPALSALAAKLILGRSLAGPEAKLAQALRANRFG